MKYIRSKHGNVIISAPIIVLTVVFCIAFFLQVSPVYLAKQRLDTYASELCRVAEISGRVGDETTDKVNKLNAVMGIAPAVQWSKSGRIQLNDTITVTCSMTYELGLFGGISSYPVALQGKATGQSEVYWK